jgi:hypothetical protein
LSGVLKYFRIAKDEPGQTFENFLSIAAIARNEGRYFPEWIEYHRLAGVEKFYIYDNESNDGTRKILEPYAKAGIVEYTYFSGERMQFKAYMDAIEKCRDKTKWLALIDLDEFIVPLGRRSIPSFLKSLARGRRDISQVAISWVIFGSSGFNKRPKGLVIENYTRRERDAESSGRFKTIVNPRHVFWIDTSHYSNVKYGTVDEDGKRFSKKSLTAKAGAPKRKIRINHYIVKSREEFLEKSARGDAIMRRNDPNYIRGESYFKAYDRNDVPDATMNRYAAPVKKAIKRAAKH